MVKELYYESNPCKGGKVTFWVHMPVGWNSSHIAKDYTTRTYSEIKLPCQSDVLTTGATIKENFDEIIGAIKDRRLQSMISGLAKADYKGMVYENMIEDDPVEDDPVDSQYLKMLTFFSSNFTGLRGRQCNWSKSRLKSGYLVVPRDLYGIPVLLTFSQGMHSITTLGVIYNIKISHNTI